MNRISTQRKRARRGAMSKMGEWLDRNWFNAILIYLVAQFILNKQLEIGVGEDRVLPASVVPLPKPKPTGYQSGEKAKPAFIPATNVSQFAKASPEPVAAAPVAQEEAVATVAVPGFSIRNLSPLLSPKSLRKRGVPESEIQAKLTVCKNYVARYVDIARDEMREYGIPASITLAQGLLESDAGESTLARQSNNHFGIKCKSRCLGCTCRNYSDDDIYDMFRVFGSPKESFREHSLLLTGQRYSRLHQLSRTDYKGWAKGLKAAGYATDPRYAEKLIQIIEALSLHQYDE